MRLQVLLLRWPHRFFGLALRPGGMGFEPPPVHEHSSSDNPSEHLRPASWRLTIPGRLDRET